DFNFIRFTFKVADNPTAATVRIYLYRSEVDWSNGTFDLDSTLGSTHISGTYYLADVYFSDAANNYSNQYLSGSSDSPLYGASITVENSRAVVDVTAPTVRDIEMSKYTENGAVVIKLTGTVGNATYDDFNFIRFTFKVADNPTAATVRIYLYRSEVDWSNGTFDLDSTLGSTHISGTYYLADVYFSDAANNYSNQYLSGSSDSPLYGASITVAKDSPSSISIAASNLDEGQLGTSLGKIQVNGKDGYGLFDLKISGADAALLEISPLGYLRLQSNVSLDFDDKQTLNFKITATNIFGESFDRSYSLSIQDLQLAPTAILLDGLNETTVKVGENKLGAFIGTLSATDGDDADTHNYALSSESEIFEISNNALKLKDGVSFNYEEQNSYTLSIITTDSTGLSYTETFTIQVTDINEAPTSLTLNSLNIPERLDGAEIGTISVIDVDANDTITITINDDRFEVVNNVLKLKDNVQLEFSQVEQITIVITATDMAGNSLQESFTLLVGSIQLDVYGVDENSAGANVGTLTVSDPSVTGDISYVLTGDDADQFEVVDGLLKLKATVSADFETKSSYSLTVTATGADNTSVEATLIINVNDLNDAPTSVSVSGNLSINENEEGASVGTLTTSDQDAGDTFSYSISGADADLFEVVDGALKLKTNVAANYEIQSTYSITITSTDAAGSKVSNDFEIKVSDMAEAAT
ncbi:cadherin repeat domain-containing protein, partial [Gammaproteobacteria bacterium]|nr:cadherin repeat domain-containing protein [Gammaproteobacteria bacterium]